ncbi:family 10 glycosylhydrolase [Pseudothermotoga sp. U03pept]|uniref:family 10 glycosylhydrolase n=1 Tax=Pseudothermotoga sp. U03pept TaxID=3447012 RepID=UPI003F0E5C4E
MKKLALLVMMVSLVIVSAGCFVVKHLESSEDQLSGDDVLLIAAAISECVDSTQRLPEECERVWQPKGKSTNLRAVKLNDAAYLMSKFFIEFCSSKQKPASVKSVQTYLPASLESGDFEPAETCTISDFYKSALYFVAETEKNGVLPRVIPVNVNGVQRKMSIDVFIPTLAKILYCIENTGNICEEIELHKALLPLSWPAKIKSVWVWGSTLANSGVEQTLDKIKDLGVTDILLLVKGTSGTVNWPSNVALGFASDTTVLPRVAQYCKTNGLRYHVWFVCNQDEKFTTTYPESKMYGIPKTQGADPQRAGKSVDFVGYSAYREYMKSLISEVIRNYDPDGLHFDYIRYPTGAWGWGPSELNKARENGLSDSDIDYLQQLAIQTWGSNGDGQSFVNAHLSGDATVTKWVELRSANVLEFLSDLVDCAKQIKPSIVISASVMPEPGSSDLSERAFGLVHYGQDYKLFGQKCELIIPMAYHKDYGKDISWITSIILGGTKQQVRSEQTKIVMGLQGYPPVTGTELAEAVADSLIEGADGVCVFRAGTILGSDREEVLKDILKQFK